MTWSLPVPAPNVPRWTKKRPRAVQRANVYSNVWSPSALGREAARLDIRSADRVREDVLDSFEFLLLGELHRLRAQLGKPGLARNPLVQAAARRFLGLDPDTDTDANPDAARRAHRQLAVACHPDRRPDDPLAQRRMQTLTSVLDYLTQPLGELPSLTPTTPPAMRMQTFGAEPVPVRIWDALTSTPTFPPARIAAVGAAAISQTAIGNLTSVFYTAGLTADVAYPWTQPPAFALFGAEMQRMMNAARLFYVSNRSLPIQQRIMYDAHQHVNLAAPDTWPEGLYHNSQLMAVGGPIWVTVDWDWSTRRPTLQPVPAPAPPFGPGEGPQQRVFMVTVAPPHPFSRRHDQERYVGDRVYVPLLLRRMRTVLFLALQALESFHVDVVVLPSFADSQADPDSAVLLPTWWASELTRLLTSSTVHFRHLRAVVWCGGTVYNEFEPLTAAAATEDNPRIPSVIVAVDHDPLSVAVALTKQGLAVGMVSVDSVAGTQGYVASDNVWVYLHTTALLHHIFFNAPLYQEAWRSQLILPSPNDDMDVL